jgi:hypothetical protein
MFQCLQHLDAQVHAYLVFPSWAVAIQLAVHLYMMCSVQARLGVLPSPPLVGLWVLSNAVIPHLLIWYLRTSLARRSAASSGSARRPASGQVTRYKQQQEQVKGEDAGSEAPSASGPSRRVQDKQQEAEADLAAIQQLKQERGKQELKQRQAQGQGHGQGHNPVPGGPSSSSTPAGGSQSPAHNITLASTTEESHHNTSISNRSTESQTHNPPELLSTAGSVAAAAGAVANSPGPVRQEQPVSAAQQHLVAPDAAQIIQVSISSRAQYDLDALSQLMLDQCLHAQATIHHACNPSHHADSLPPGLLAAAGRPTPCAQPSNTDGTPERQEAGR